MQLENVDILLRQAETQYEGLRAVMSMCDASASSQKQLIETIKLLREDNRKKGKRILELESQLSKLTNPNNFMQIPSDSSSDRLLYNALTAIRPYVHHLGDWYLIERICYEQRLIKFAHINDHTAFIDKLNEWGISVQKSNTKLNANHLSKGAILDNVAVFPYWKLKSGLPCPDKKITLIHRFLSLFPEV